MIASKIFDVKQVPGTQKLHCIKPISNSFVSVKEYSCSSKKTKKRVAKHRS